MDGEAREQMGRLKDGKMSPPIQRLLCPQEVAEILQIHLSSVYRLAHRGDLPSIVIPPRTLRFSLDELQAFMVRCRKGRGKERLRIPRE